MHVFKHFFNKETLTLNNPRLHYFPTLLISSANLLAPQVLQTPVPEARTTRQVQNSAREGSGGGGEERVGRGGDQVDSLCLSHDSDGRRRTGVGESTNADSVLFASRRVSRVEDGKERPLPRPLAPFVAVGIFPQT